MFTIILIFFPKWFFIWESNWIINYTRYDRRIWGNGTKPLFETKIHNFIYFKHISVNNLHNIVGGKLYGKNAGWEMEWITERNMKKDVLWISMMDQPSIQIQCLIQSQNAELSDAFVHHQKTLIFYPPNWIPPFLCHNLKT